MELMTNPQQLPELSITVRPGTLDDLPFIDGLQRMHTKQVGWMPTAQFEGKIKANHVLVAENAAQERLGYLIGNDQYFKRDDVGIIYQINVVPGVQRGLIGATLLKSQFERSAWGCRLYCCWCAQDIAANHFWAAMGFVPLAFRTGSAKKDRVHIFWQKRIVAGDDQTPWWFPSQTAGGSIREDRIVLPIPHGVRWFDEMPRILPNHEAGETTDPQQPVAPALPSPAGRSARVKPPTIATPAPAATGLSRLMVVPNPTKPIVKPKAIRPPPAPKTPKKNNPKLVAAARELRDRWLEAVNRGEQIALPNARYNISRQLGQTSAIAPAMRALPMQAA